MIQIEVSLKFLSCRTSQHELAFIIPIPTRPTNHPTIFAFSERDGDDEKEIAIIVLLETADGIQTIVDSLPECGGFVTGDTCSAIVSVAKVALAVALTAARIVSIGKSLESAHAACYFLVNF
jgi:hypothetical protein